jgi:hypothetical protein
MKPLQLKDLTELSQEWELHDGKFKKFTLVINFVHGVPHIKYGVYRGKLCICLSKNLTESFDRYVALQENDVVVEHAAEQEVNTEA